MKKLLFPIFVCTLALTRLSAQAPFNTMDSIDVNNITANMLVHGDMMWNPIDYSVSGCKYPAHTVKFINFTAALWISGYDAGDNLHIAAQTYRQKGNDFWPGPLDNSDTLTYAASYAWAKIWKVNRSDIDYFKLLSSPNISNTPQAILTWPGKGNTHARGNAGTALLVDHDMAPFIDLNGNGIYEPLQGDYPDIKGDQALWWVFSDNGPTHTETNGKPLDVEVHAMAYGYHRNTLIDNVVYLDYTIINKSVNNYTDVRAAWYDDVQVGYYDNDYIGFNSTRRMGICYNGTSYDGTGIGQPPSSYGAVPPQSGLTLVKLPGDVGSSYVPAGSFGYINNDTSYVGNPAIDTEYNNYMRAKTRSGRHFVYDTAHAWLPSGPDTNYLYTGTLASHLQWSECALNNTPGDRRVVLSTNDFSLTAGTSQHITIAFVVADSAGSCGSTTFNNIEIMADTAWSNYYNSAMPNAVKNVPIPNGINIYPNPAHDKLYVENVGAATGLEWTSVYNSIGQKMNVTITKTATQAIIDLSQLPPGLYHIVCANGAEQKSATFVKD